MYSLSSGLSTIHSTRSPNPNTLPPPRKNWWRRPGSNRRPPVCKAGALPTELRPHMRQRLPAAAPMCFCGLKPMATTPHGVPQTFASVFRMTRTGRELRYSQNERRSLLVEMAGIEPTMRQGTCYQRYSPPKHSPPALPSSPHLHISGAAENPPPLYINSLPPSQVEPPAATYTPDKPLPWI